VGFHETFWLAVGAAAPVIALAAVVTYNDSFKNVELFERERGTPEQEAQWRPLERKATRVVSFVGLTAFLNLVGQGACLVGALVSLENQHHDYFPPLIAEIVLPLGIGLLALSGWENVVVRYRAREWQALKRRFEETPKKDRGPAIGGNPYDY
jgi:hypothetical protein